MLHNPTKRKINLFGFVDYYMLFWHQHYLSCSVLAYVCYRSIDTAILDQDIIFLCLVFCL